MALIGMEERKSGFMPLCNHFSKHAIEERIRAVMKIEEISARAQAAAAAVGYLRLQWRMYRIIRHFLRNVRRSLLYVKTMQTAILTHNILRNLRICLFDMNWIFQTFFIIPH